MCVCVCERERAKHRDTEIHARESSRASSVGPARGASLKVRFARFRTALCTTHAPCCLADPRRAARARTAARADAGSSSQLFLCQPPFTCLALRECLEHAFTPRTILTHALGDALAPTGYPRCDPAMRPRRRDSTKRKRAALSVAAHTAALTCLCSCLPRLEGSCGCRLAGGDPPQCFPTLSSWQTRVRASGGLGTSKMVGRA